MSYPAVPNAARSHPVKNARFEAASGNTLALLRHPSLIGATESHMTIRRAAELATATLGEGALLLVIAATGWATRQPLIFASLGPTAYELVERPRDRSARTYNIIVGHLVGLGSGFLALYLMHAWNTPNVLLTGVVDPARLWAVVLAAVLTTLGTLLLRAGQPAAIATSLLVALGSMQTGRDALAIVAAVFLIAAVGQPMRHLRMKVMTEVKHAAPAAVSQPAGPA
jgi:HPP family